MLFQEVVLYTLPGRPPQFGRKSRICKKGYYSFDDVGFGKTLSQNRASPGREKFLSDRSSQTKHRKTKARGFSGRQSESFLFGGVDSIRLDW